MTCLFGSYSSPSQPILLLHDMSLWFLFFSIPTNSSITRHVSLVRILLHPNQFFYYTTSLFGSYSSPPQPILLLHDMSLWFLFFCIPTNSSITRHVSLVRILLHPNQFFYYMTCLFGSYSSPSQPILLLHDMSLWFVFFSIPTNSSITRHVSLVRILLHPNQFFYYMTCLFGSYSSPSQPILLLHDMSLWFVFFSIPTNSSITRHVSLVRILLHPNQFFYYMTCLFGSYSSPSQPILLLHDMSLWFVFFSIPTNSFITRHVSLVRILLHPNQFFYYTTCLFGSYSSPSQPILLLHDMSLWFLFFSIPTNSFITRHVSLVRILLHPNQFFYYTTCLFGSYSSPSQRILLLYDMSLWFLFFSIPTNSSITRHVSLVRILLHPNQFFYYMTCLFGSYSSPSQPILLLHDMSLWFLFFSIPTNSSITRHVSLVRILLHPNQFFYYMTCLFGSYSSPSQRILLLHGKSLWFLFFSIPTNSSIT